MEIASWALFRALVPHQTIVRRGVRAAGGERRACSSARRATIRRSSRKWSRCSTWSDRSRAVPDSAPQALYASLHADGGQSRGRAHRRVSHRGAVSAPVAWATCTRRSATTTSTTREVAIKITRADVCNPGAAQRFRAERQILVALDHRNIARLLDRRHFTPNGLPLCRHGTHRRRADRHVLRNAQARDARASAGFSCRCARPSPYAHQRAQSFTAI